MNLLSLKNIKAAEEWIYENNKKVIPLFIPKTQLNKCEIVWVKILENGSGQKINIANMFDSLWRWKWFKGNGS